MERDPAPEAMANGDAIRMRVLAETSRAFASVARDYRQLVDTIARTCADLVGDGCLVTLLDSDSVTLFSAACAHRDPALEADYRAYHAQLGVSKISSKTVTATVVRTGEPKLVALVDPATVVAQTDESLKPIVTRMNVHSFVVVPIRAHETIIGTLSMLRSGPHRSYTTDDLVMLLDIADRAGLAIENARLYRDLERRVRERTAELEVLNQELEAFSYSVAHDLRAPVRRIDGFTRAILEDFGGELDAEARRYLTHVTDSTRAMDRLIEGLLELSQVTRAKLVRASVDITGIANTVTARLRDASPAREVEVVIHDGMAAQADPRLVDVILTNLIGNAWKFTRNRDGSRIMIGVEDQEGVATFFVNDNGAGFDPAYAERLFGAFQRLHSDTDFEGTGIGLATVQRIVRRHGGRIWATGAVGHGAAFYFTLEPPP